MNMKGLACRYILPILMLVMVCTCSTDGCLDNQSSIPLAGFYSSSSKSAISIDSLSIYGVGVPGDSMLANCETVSQVYLPLDMEHDSTCFVIHYNHAELSDTAYNDTITINYVAVPYFVSEECGAMYYYDITEYSCTTHLLDSMQITTDRFTNVDTETVKIYVRTSD